jgi:hypothetical protein
MTPPHWHVGRFAAPHQLTLLRSTTRSALFLLVALVAVPTQAQHAVQFDGVDDHVDVLNGFDEYAPAHFTTELWVKPTGGSGVRFLASSERSGQTRGWLIYLLGDGRVRFDLGTGSAWNHITGLAALPLEQWSHVAVSYDGTTGRLFVDGIEVASAAMGYQPPQPQGFFGAPGMTIGARATMSDYFTGQIDNVRIWGRARTASEIGM